MENFKEKKEKLMRKKNLPRKQIWHPPWSNFAQTQSQHTCAVQCQRGPENRKMFVFGSFWPLNPERLRQLALHLIPAFPLLYRTLWFDFKSINLHTSSCLETTKMRVFCPFRLNCWYHHPQNQS